MARHGHMSMRLVRAITHRSRHVPASKARQILREGKARGRKLSRRQKGLFGLIAGGGTPSRLRRKK